MHPVLFEIGGFKIFSYGALLAAAFLTTVTLARRRAVALGMEGEKIIDLSILLIISGVAGARLMFVLLNIDIYRSDPLSAFRLWEGGLVWYGGLILALTCAVIFLKINKMPVLKTGDLMMPYVALGQSIGRIGCFMNGCCYGKPTILPIGVTFDVSRGPVIPTQLIEAAAMFAVYLILRKRLPSNGRTLFLYLILYSAFRFFIEFLRGDNPAVWLGLTVSQLISTAIFAAAVASWKIILSK